MRFTFDFLVRVHVEPAARRWRASCASAGIVSEGDTEGDALTSARVALRVLVDAEAVNHIRAAASNGVVMRCPLGQIDFAADRWFCKETRRDCPIDASIVPASLEGSLHSCNASESAKSTVRGAVADGYAGLHHKSGTYFCPECRDRTKYRSQSLRYPCELTTIGKVIPVSDTDAMNTVRRQMALSNVSPRGLSHGLCAHCLRDAIGKIMPVVSSQLHLVTLDVQL